ncbi:MFS transporter [Vibrio gallicus]|uniref:MFS transporter n=1 Tax=Vibrio gallicus TaxID=190897 RepID=UPI0021C35D7E|nr:MFS transporter [Vibrio gallicus]
MKTNSSRAQQIPFTSWLAIIGILLLAANLRGPFTSLAPLLEQIMESLQLSTTITGLLSSLPLLTFAFISPLALPLLKYLQLKKSICFALFAILVGIGLRSAGHIALLCLGTVFIGIGVAIGNVLLPVAVKQSYPYRIAIVTSLYTFSMGFGSTLTSSLMVPLSHLNPSSLQGWQFALLFNLCLTIPALIFWLLKPSSSNAQSQSSSLPLAKVLRSKIAWQVTLALGFNSITFYAFAAWLPKILIDSGLAEAKAGYIYGLLQFATIWPGLVLIPLLAKLKSSQILILCTALGTVSAVIGLMLAPEFAVIWTILFGFCNCATFVITLSFIGLRTNNSHEAAALSAMSQSLGYLIATVGPPILGMVHAFTHSWNWALGVVVATGLVCAVFSGFAARDRKL